MSFPLGKPILVMIALALAGAAWLGLRATTTNRPDLIVWVFADSHLQTYQSLAGPYEKQTGKKMGVELVSTRSEDVRLISLFMSGARDVPDVVELEIGSVAKYFRPPVSQIGLLPLNVFLKESGWLEKIPAARLAPWSKDGVIFGIPHDVHPCAIVYRSDLFEEAGINLPAMKTWPAFREACVRFQDYWRGRGVANRHAMELMDTSADHLIPMLLQRHINPIDPDGTIHLMDEKVVETLAFYARCVAGREKIGAQSAGAAGGLARDLIEGNIGALIVPDWRVDQIKQYAPELAGKMRMMAMPVFEADDARTATWGGTMMGIPRNCKDSKAAWKLVEALNFSQAGIAARRRHSSILPPVTTLWNDAVYQRHDDYFGGQQIDLLYIELAREIPARYVTPATPVAGAYLSKAIVDAAAYVNGHPEDEAGLLGRIRDWMGESAKDLRRRIEHSRIAGSGQWAVGRKE